MEYALKDIELLFDAREDDSASSWVVGATSYGMVLAEAHIQCPRDRHVMTLAEYIDLWRGTVAGGSRACNEADVWARFEKDRKEDDPISYVRHPFLSTVLVDTYLRDFSYYDGNYSANVFHGDRTPVKRILLPPTGKIYEVNQWGLPTRTGGRKIVDSEAFEHRWWSFSSDRVFNGNEIDPDFEMVLFGNGGTIGCFCNLIQAHYSKKDSGGFYRVLTLPN